VHRLVANVFKVIFFSLFAMIILDTTLMVVDSITVYSRVNSLAGIMKHELIRNNCIPYESGQFFIRELTRINEMSRVSTRIISNINQDMIIDGVRYNSVGQVNQVNYGEFQTLVIEITMNPSVIFFLNVNREDRDMDMYRGFFQYTIVHRTVAPGLRYLR